MLPPLEGGMTGQVDGLARTETNSRNEARARELATVNIIEAAAAARADRAERTKTRGAVELRDWKVGEAVDIWFDPTNKDQPGWRGPATITGIHPEEGNLSVKIQGRTLKRMNQEVRPHIAYLTCMMAMFAGTTADFHRLQEFVEGMRPQSTIIFGVIFVNNGPNKGWRLTKQTGTPEGYSILQSALAVAHHAMYVPTCTTVRLWKGITALQALIGFTESEVTMWLPEGGGREQLVQFSAEPGDLDKAVPGKALAQEFVEEWYSDRTGWKDVWFYSVSKSSGPRRR